MPSPDDQAVSATITFTAAEGTLSGSDQLTGGNGSYAISGREATELRDILRDLDFEPAENTIDIQILKSATPFRTTTFTVQVSDTETIPKSDSSSDFAVEVTPVNDAPVAVADVLDVDEDLASTDKPVHPSTSSATTPTTTSMTPGSSPPWPST